MTQGTVFDDLDREPVGRAPAHPKEVPETWRLIPDVDLVAYYADEIAPDPSLSNSGMSVLLNETPLDFAYGQPRLNPEAVERAKSTAAQRRGDVVHQLALGKGAGFAIAPDDFPDWRGKRADFRDEAEANGLTPVLAHKFEEAEIMAEVIRRKIDDVLEGAPYETEVAFLYQEQTEAGPIWIRGLMDVWCAERATILDPKITARLYDDSVARHVLAMGWDRQGALYSHAVGMIYPELAGRVQFADLMVKPAAPYTSRLVAPEKAWEYSSIKQCRLAMERFGRCLYEGRWPGFSNRVERIAMPAWEDRRREALELGEGR